ncbi:MAG: archaeosortase/exosortase family protein [Planctomycetota bacterium]|nr:archaeosortase/exosortase family protein [Planctomycetota bacterium]
MNTPSEPHHTSARTAAHLTILIRFGILLILMSFAFRKELYSIVALAAGFSEWSHVFAMPVVAMLFVLCRMDDIRIGLRKGSIWGAVLVLLGFAIWMMSTSLRFIGYATLVAMLVCFVGLILAVAGWRVLRICLPLVLMLGLCLPLGERTMERFSIDIQRESLRAALIPLKLLPGVKTRTAGMTIAYSYDGKEEHLGLAEQRFGARLWPACLVVGLFTVFSRRRPRWQVVFLTLASIPIVAFCNLMRIFAWAVLAVYGGFGPVSSAPRNASLGISLIVAYGSFAFGCWLLPKLGSRIQRPFWIEDDVAADDGA